MSLALGTLMVSGILANQPSVLAETSTEQQISDYKKKLDDLAAQLTQNTMDSAKLETDLAARKVVVADQMRSVQLNSQYANTNILYQIFFNHLSLEQAVAMTHVVNQSIASVERLKRDEARLAQEKKDITEQEAQVQVVLDTLYSKFNQELADAEAAKQAVLATQAEAAKKAAPAATASNAIAVPVPAQPSESAASTASSSAAPSSSTSSASSSSSSASNASSSAPSTPPESSTPPVSASNSWADWPPAVAAQYVSNGTGVSAKWWLTILYRESGGNPTAVNPASGTYGYFQMNGSAHGGIDYAAMSPQQYLDAVIGLYQSQGAGAWGETDY
ncbi:MAG: transglycosylase family protein [Streptococcaceae bacterium]|nr:transglycosylase family protein [Streptococcaceae bacterium]